jgi:hypothetical protein
MFATIIVLTLVAVGFEIVLVGKIKPLLNLLERYKLAALVFSLILSVMLGALFGAAGLIVFVAGLCSTFLVQPYYRLKKRGTIDLMRSRIDETKANLNRNKDVYVRRMHQLVRGVRLIVKILIAPFVIIGMIMDRIDDIAAVLKKLHSRLTRS